MKTLGQRVKEERTKRKWSQATLGAKVGATQAAISEVERDVPKSSGLVIPIAKAFKLDVTYLTDGVEVHHKQNDDMVFVGALGSSEPPRGREYVMIPRYDVEGSCGMGIDVNDVSIIDGIPMPVDWLKAQGLPDAHFLAVVQASGESMAPTIEDKQVLMINTLETEPRSTKIYIVCVDGRLFIKRLIYTPDGWIMRSDNPNKEIYPDFKIDPAKMDSVNIQGRVVWKSGML